MLFVCVDFYACVCYVDAFYYRGLCKMERGQCPSLLLLYVTFNKHKHFPSVIVLHALHTLCSERKLHLD